MARETAASDGDSGPSNELLLRLILDFDELDRQVRGGEPTVVLASVVSLATNRIAAARTVSVSTLSGTEFVTVAASDDQARRADDLQQLTGEGPCLDTFFRDGIYNPHDLAHDRRWPVFGTRISAELGLHSMLSYRLTPHADPDESAGSPPPGAGGGRPRRPLVASLNIYGAHPHAFDEQAVITGLLLATHARTAIEATLATQRADHLDTALESSREIGTAIGILMARHVITRQQAFTALKVTSQRLNRKLRDIAVDVTDTGELPER